ITQKRHLVLGLHHLVVNQPAKNDQLVVVHHDMGIQAAFVGDEVRGTACSRGYGGYLLGDLQTHRIALVDLRADLQLDTHVLTLDGVEGLTGVFHRAADDERYVLTDNDFRFFVIQRQQTGGGQDVARAVSLQGIDQQPDLGTADGTHAAQGSPVRQRRRSGYIALEKPVDAGGQVEDAAIAPGKVDHPHSAVLVGEAPLHAEFPGAVGGDLGDHRLDQHLGPADIQLADDLGHFPAQLGG